MLHSSTKGSYISIAVHIAIKYEIWISPFLRFYSSLDNHFYLFVVELILMSIVKTPSHDSHFLYRLVRFVLSCWLLRAKLQSTVWSLRRGQDMCPHRQNLFRWLPPCVHGSWLPRWMSTKLWRQPKLFSHDPVLYRRL